MRIDDEGYRTFDDISTRPGASIYLWDVDERGKVQGVVQQDPQDSSYNYMHIDKLVYVVDDIYTPYPDGMGLLRQLVEPGRRLEQYEQLEGWGYDNDMRGMPKIWSPRAEMEKDGMTPAEIDEIEFELVELASDHSYNPDRGIILESDVYRSQDNDKTPSAVRKFDVETMQGQPRSHAEMAAAIQRLKHEMFQTMSMDTILTGSDGVGSYALSKDKTQSCYLMINAAMDTIREVVDNSLVASLWRLNGWDEELRPVVQTSVVDHKDIYQMATAFRDIGMAAPTLPQSATEQWFGMAGIELEEDAMFGQMDGGEEAVDIDEPMEEETPAAAAGMGKAVKVDRRYFKQTNRRAA